MTNTSASYHVHAVLSTGGLWQGSVDELPGVTDAHRSLSQLETRMRTAIGKHLDPDAPSSVQIELTLIPSTGDPGLDEELAEARELRRQANELQDKAHLTAVPLAKRLAVAGVSRRDAGTLLDISGSWVAKMIAEKTPSTADAPSPE